MLPQPRSVFGSQWCVHRAPSRVLGRSIALLDSLGSTEPALDSPLHRLSPLPSALRSYLLRQRLRVPPLGVSFPRGEQIIAQGHTVAVGSSKTRDDHPESQMVMLDEISIKRSLRKAYTKARRLSSAQFQLDRRSLLLHLRARSLLLPSFPERRDVQLRDISSWPCLAFLPGPAWL